MMRIVILCVFAANALRAQQPMPHPESGTHADSMARAVASIVRLPPSAFPEIPRAVRGVLEFRDCLIPQRHVSIGDTTLAGREADRAVRSNVLRGQFFERGKFAWAVLCSAHGITSIVFLPDDGSLLSTASGQEMTELSSRPDATWIQPDGGGAWTLRATMFLAKASAIDRARDGAKLDRAEKARPVHDGLVMADMSDGSGYTIYWTGRRWIQVASYD